MKKLWVLGAAFVVLASGAGCSAKHGAGSSSDGRVAISVTEKGFEPEVVNVAAGKPVTLVVTRKTDHTCATDLVMPDYQINQPLPLNQAVEITFTPKAAGDIKYACAMDMYKGTVHAE